MCLLNECLFFRGWRWWPVQLGVSWMLAVLSVSIDSFYPNPTYDVVSSASFPKTIFGDDTFSEICDCKLLVFLAS